MPAVLASYVLSSSYNLQTFCYVGPDLKDDDEKVSQIKSLHDKQIICNVGRSFVMWVETVPDVSTVSVKTLTTEGWMVYTNKPQTTQWLNDNYCVNYL